MELQLFGINHKTTKLSERELFIINDSNQEEFKYFIQSTFKNSIESFFALSTCNRTEVYLYAEILIAGDVMDKTASFLGCSDVLKKDFYFFNGTKAMEHMCCVASGLDSQVLGEQEIFGQFKKSIKSFCALKTLHGDLKRISDGTISIAKAARTETQIGVNPLSVSGLSLKIVKEIFENPRQQQVTIVGAGQMAFSVIENFYNNGLTNIHAVNRTRKKLEISQSLVFETSPLAHLASYIHNTDILVSSISTPLPIIGKGLIENALRARKNKPMLLIDLGVPRNIEDQVRDLEHAYLFTIEDIELVTQENLGERGREAKKALKIIQKKLKEDNLGVVDRNNRNDAYKSLQQLTRDLNEMEIVKIYLSDDPYQELAQTLDASDDRLQYLSDLSPHAILSMIKEIKSA